MSDPVQQSRLKDLIAKAKEQNYLTYAEVNDHLPEDISDPDQVEEIIQMINDLGIQVFEEAPDAEALLLTSGDTQADEIADEAVAALTAVESEAGRTTDPVRMYMREMGTVELLTREGEIQIAKRIEEGIRETMAAISYFPGTIEQVLKEYDLVATEERYVISEIPLLGSVGGSEVWTSWQTFDGSRLSSIEGRAAASIDVVLVAVTSEG